VRPTLSCSPSSKLVVAHSSLLCWQRGCRACRTQHVLAHALCCRRRYTATATQVTPHERLLVSQTLHISLMVGSVLGLHVCMLLPPLWCVAGVKRCRPAYCSLRDCMAAFFALLCAGGLATIVSLQSTCLHCITCCKLQHDSLVRCAGSFEVGVPRLCLRRGCLHFCYHSRCLYCSLWCATNPIGFLARCCVHNFWPVPRCQCWQ
jgi:hypothetical protein